MYSNKMFKYGFWKIRPPQLINYSFIKPPKNHVATTTIPLPSNISSIEASV